MAGPNGVSTVYSYHKLSRLLLALHQKGTTLVESAGYAYDAVGNRLTDVFGGTNTYNNSNELTSYPVYGYTWTYDNKGNATGKTVSGSTDPPPIFGPNHNMSCSLLSGPSVKTAAQCAEPGHGSAGQRASCQMSVLVGDKPDSQSGP